MLGMIKGGAADRAGIRQGDQVLRVNGEEIGSLSPFKVAGLLQGTDSDSDSNSFVDVAVSPHQPGLLMHTGSGRCHIKQLCREIAGMRCHVRCKPIPFDALGSRYCCM